MQKVKNQNEKECLRFGQSIYIQPSNFYSSFCITGDGYINNKAQLFEVDQNKAGAGCIFTQSLFQIYPSFMTSRLDQAQNIDSEIEDKNKINENKFVKKIHKMEQMVIQEYKLNIELSEKTINVPVSFSQSVQFLHKASNKFLACNFIQADIEQENFKLELNEFPSSKTCFKFSPVYDYQSKEDALIYSGTSFYIMMENIYLGITPFLHVGEDEKIHDNLKPIIERTMFNFPNHQVLETKMVENKQQKIPEALHPENIEDPSPNTLLIQQDYKTKQNISSSIIKSKIQRPSQLIMKQSSYSKKREINVSLEKKSHFQLTIFSNQIQDENLICFGDIIWLHHLEQNAILITSKNLYDEIVVNLLSQSPNDQLTDFIGHSNGMWYIEHHSLMKGGKIEWGQTVRLRHFSLGKYLAIKTIEQSSDTQKSQSCFYLCDKPNDDSQLAFFPLPSDSQDQSQVNAKYVTKDAFMKLKAMSIKGKSQWIQFINNDKTKPMDESYKLNQRQDEDIHLVMIRLSDYSRDDDVLNFYKATFNETQEQSFLISCLPIMIKTLNILKILNQTKDQKKVIQLVSTLKLNKKLNQFQNVVENLDKFCKNQHINIHMGSRINLQVNQNRQKVLKEQYFIETLLEILKYISDEQELQKYQQYSLRQKPTFQKPSIVSLKIRNSMQLIIEQQNSTQVRSSIPTNHNQFQKGLIVSKAVRGFTDQFENLYYNFVNKKVYVIKLIYRLLITICEGNIKNECYVYNKIAQFQYQAKFIKETTYFIISLLVGNQLLLNNLTNTLNQVEGDINITSFEDQSNHLSLQNHPNNKSMKLDQLRQISKRQNFDEQNSLNNIIFFYKQLTQDTHRSPVYLEFFKSISKFQHTAIRPNQNMIHNIQMESKSFSKSLFVNIHMQQSSFMLRENNSMTVENLEGTMMCLQDIKDPSQLQYLVSQLELYSDLASGRNFVWKKYVENIFSMDFVFNQIFDKLLSEDIRSSFCKIALSVYVDREPYNLIILPNLCRFINQKQQSKQQVMIHGQEDDQKFKGLMRNTFQYIIEHSQSKREQMINMAKFSHKQNQKNNSEIIKEDTTLTLEIMKMAKTLINLDIITSTNQRDQITIILPSLIKLLEFDRFNVALPYILQVTRDENLQKAIQTQNKLVSGIKSVIGEAVSVITDIGKFVTSSLMMIKVSDGIEKEFVEFKSSFLNKNPIISSLISITNSLQNQQQKYQVFNQEQIKVDLQIKHEICDILIYLQEQRLDFLITNFICSFYDKVSGLQKSNHQIGEFGIKFTRQQILDFVTIVPSTLRTGIDSIDNKLKQKAKESGNVFRTFGQSICSIGGLLKNKPEFTNYCDQYQNQIHDLDYLMSNSNSSSYRAQILPSLLITLHLTQDQGLLDKIIQVMRRCFSQKKELFQNLENVEILYDQNELDCYNFIQGSLQSFKIMSEGSEVWLKSFKINNSGQELVQLAQTLNNLSSILQQKFQINSDQKLIQIPLDVSEPEIVSTKRQKMFTLCNVQVVLMNFIKDSQHRLIKILNDKDYNQQVKSNIIILLKETYTCLNYYCKGNLVNQNILFVNIDLILDDIAHDFGQMELACSIVQDNMYICENFPESILSKILNFISMYGRQTRFLNIFGIIQSHKKMNLVENQIKVLDLLLPQNQSQFKQELINQREFWLYGTLDKQFQLKLVFHKHFDKQAYDQPYDYHSKLFDILLQTTMGEESFKLNSPRLKNTFKLDYLVELLSQNDDLSPKSQGKFINNEERSGFTILKPKIILSINHIYLNNKLIHHQTIIRQQQGFFNIFERELIRFQSYNQHSVDSQVEFFRYSNYFFDHLITLLIYFSGRIISQEMNEEYKNLDEYICLSKMCKVILFYSSRQLANLLTVQQFNNLIRFITNVDQLYYHNNKIQFSQCLKIQLPLPKLQNGKNDFGYDSGRCLQIFSFINKGDKDLIAIQDIFTPQGNYENPDESPIMNSSPFRYFQVNSQQKEELKKNLPTSGQNIQDFRQYHNNGISRIAWEKYLKVYTDSSILQREIYKELSTLATSFMNIDQLIPEQITKQCNLKIEFKIVLKKIIKHIEYGLMNKSNKDNLIYSLEILEEILEQAEDLREMQNLFDHNEATKMIFNLISEYKSYPLEDDFLYQLLSFACKLMQDGNVQVQKSIFNYFTNETKSEYIFAQFNRIIHDQINELKQSQNVLIYEDNDQIQKNGDVILQHNVAHHNRLEDLAYAQINSNKKEYQSNRGQQLIMERLLQLLQLFCVGHNIDLQNYILYQSNSRNNYNLVKSLVELLYIYHFDLTKENFDIIQMCIDTLSELVRGSCCANQQQIIDSKFLEIANTFLTIQIPKINKDKTKQSDDQKQQTNSQQIERWMLERIKYKSMILVTSLIEFNTDNFALNRIISLLPIEVLRYNLMKIHRRHKKAYGNQYTKMSLKHIEADTENPKFSPEYHELILETGYLIFFLIIQYSDMIDQTIDKETDYYGIKQISDVQIRGIFQSLSIIKFINQLFGFVFEIICAIFSSAYKGLQNIQAYVESKYLKDLEKKKTKKTHSKNIKYQNPLKEALNFFAINTAHIEVLIHDRIQRVHFIKLPHCHYLPDETKLEFHNNVNRNSQKTKIQELLAQSINIINICQHEEDLAIFFNQNKFLSIFANYTKLWKDMAFFFTILLNILIILSFHDGDSSNNLKSKYYDRIYSPRLLKDYLNEYQTKELFTYSGYSMIISSTFVVVFQLSKKAPVVIKQAWNQRHPILRRNHGQLIKTLLQVYIVFRCTFKVLQNSELLYYLAYVVFAYVATFIHPFFFAFHLTEIFFRYHSLRTIIKSFWQPKKALFLLFILIIIINYYFTIIGYSYYSDLYQSRCGNMLFCFMESFDKTFKNFGGIGGWFDLYDKQKASRFDYGRFFFENLFNLIMVVILIKIFSQGIIVVTFQSLREKQIIKNKDIRKKCFICGLTREFFDHNSVSGFVQHTKQEHYMWNYLFFISFINNKKLAEYTGIESYIAQKIKLQDHSWIPINRALGVQNIVLDTYQLRVEQLKEIQIELLLVKKNIWSIATIARRLMEKIV